MLIQSTKSIRFEHPDLGTSKYKEDLNEPLGKSESHGVFISSGNLQAEEAPNWIKNDPYYALNEQSGWVREIGKDQNKVIDVPVISFDQLDAKPSDAPVPAPKDDKQSK